MSNTTIKTKKVDSKCVVISDERKRQIRAVIEAGQVYYCASDIAACMGYSAPEKAVYRSGMTKVKLNVPWVSKQRKGYVAAYCLTKEQVMEFVDRMEVGDDFMEWLFGQVIPEAEAAFNKEELGRQENVVVPMPQVQPQIVQPQTAQFQTAQLIERLDQIIMDAALLKHELRKTV